MRTESGGCEYSHPHGRHTWTETNDHGELVRVICDGLED